MITKLPLMFCVPLVFGSLLCWKATADESPLPVAPSPERIAQWIQQLDAGRFAERSEASRNLEAAGRTAFPALADAAVGDSREARVRALEILRKYFQEGDEGSKQAAREALEKIAASGNEAAAGRAKEVLHPKPAPVPMPVPGFAVPQIRIQVNAIGGRQNQRIQINNGVKQIEAEDGQRKVKITEDPAQGIQLEITEKKDGQETTEKIQAKNAEELKQNHPDAHKIYDRLSKPLGGIHIQPGAVPAGFFPAPARLPAAMNRAGAARMLQSSRRLLESGVRQLEQTRGDGEEGKQLEESIQRLKEITKQIEEEEAKLSQK